MVLLIFLLWYGYRNEDDEKMEYIMEKWRIPLDKRPKER